MAQTVPWIGTSAARAGAMLACAALLFLMGCSDDPVPIPGGARTVDLAAFSDRSLLAASNPARPEVVEVPGKEFRAPEILESTQATELADGDTVTQSTTSEHAVDPATQESATQVVARTRRQSARVGQRWPVESLVGQINGRPIYADEFFRPIEARLIQLAASPDQARARAEADQAVRARFTSMVNSELVIAEAQSRLTPEMQKGVIAWLREMQEQTIAAHGGSRAEAERQLIEETGLDLEGNTQEQKERALLNDLLRRKVDPRVIVSWRDVEQLYEQNRALFAPEPICKLGRIILYKDSQAEQVQLATKMFAEGKSFAEVAKAVNARENGAWREVRVGPNGMELSDLSSDELAAALQPLKPGQVAGPIDFRTTVVWVSVLEQTKPEVRGIFDRDLQMAMRNELVGRRTAAEREHYIYTLRSRWMSDDIVKMEQRLLLMAKDRYFDPMRN